ncbi:hypothetical protein [Streptomyces sp. NPDC058308]
MVALIGLLIAAFFAALLAALFVAFFAASGVRFIDIDSSSPPPALARFR